MRHGIAANGSVDKNRPLTDVGSAEVFQLGQQIKSSGCSLPQKIYVSEATRTQQTFRQLQKSIGQTIEYQICPELYSIDIESFDPFIWGLDEEVEHALIIGHNPTISQYATLCLQRPILFKPGQLARLTQEAESWNDCLQNNWNLET